MDYLNDFALDLARQDKSDNTVDSYQRHIKDYIAFIEEKIGEFSSEEILELDIKEYRNYLQNVKDQKPSTINVKLIALNSYCEFLKGEKALNNNPVKNVNPVRVQQKSTAPSTLSKNELYKLRREFYKGDNKRDIAIFELLYNSGARSTELCHVGLDDIVLSPRKGTLIIRSGKGNKYREIPLNKVARRAIEDYLGVRPNRDKFLIQGERGPMTRSGIFSVINKYAKQVGLDMSPKRLRHQFCKDMLDSGESITTVAVLAGHGDINTTMRYTLPTESDKENAVESLSRGY